MTLVLAAIGVLSFALEAHAQGQVNDAQGFRWDISSDGRIGDGTNDTFDGGMYLRVNGTQFRAPHRGGRAPAKEFKLGPTPCGNLRISRWVYINRKDACARYLEIIENPGKETVKATVTLYSNLGGSIQQNSMPKPRNGGVAYAALGQQPARSSLGFRFGDDRTKFPANITMRGDDVTTTFKPVKVKPGKRVAIMHIVAQRRTMAEAEAFVKKLKMRAYLRDLPPKLRKVVVNARQLGLLELGKLELFRGEHGDVVKLRTGEQISGALKTASFTLSHEFGTRTIPGHQVLTLFSLPSGRCRLVLENGEIITGKLAETSLGFGLRGGNPLAIPFNHLDKYGRQLPSSSQAENGKPGDKKPAAQENEEGFVFIGPIFILRGGDRLVGNLKGTQLSVRTLCGRMQLPLATLRSIMFPNKELKMPHIELKDGSGFLGLIDDTKFSIELTDGTTVSLSPHRLAGVHFTTPEGFAEPKTETKDPAREKPGAPMPERSSKLAMINGDVFAGELVGQQGVLKFDTPFGKQRVPTGQVLSVAFLPETWGKVRVALWDASALPGKLSGETLAFKTTSGAVLQIPYGVAKSFTSNYALPPEARVKQIEALVLKLADNDASVRNDAHKELMRQDSAIRGVLARFWDHEDLEVRSRVRRIFTALEKGEE
jgi:hypothetical protein